MNIKKLLETQKALDDRIRKEKGLEGQDLTANTFLALLVELGEMANEWNVWKHWKENPRPKSGLLEEYVDAIHFFLSLALQKGWLELDLNYETIKGIRAKKHSIELDLLDVILEIYDSICDARFKNSEEDFYFALDLFFSLGIIGFDFELEQIEEAYYKKNQINHQRQEDGY